MNNTAQTPVSNDKASKHIGHVKVSRKKWWLLIAIFLTVVIMGVAGGYYWYRSTTVTTAQVEATAQQANALIADDNYSQAVTLWQPLLQRPMSKEVECLANLKYANTLQANGQYRDANSLYLNVLDNCKEYNEFELTVGIAKSYDGLNNTSKAIEYYQKAVDIEKAKLQNNVSGIDRAQVERNIANYTEVIQELKPYL